MNPVHNGSRCARTTAGALMAALTLLTTTYAAGPQPSPLPELIYYNFDGAGSTVNNLAAPATRVNLSGTLMGALTQGGTSSYPSGMVGTGGSVRTDYLNTGWTTNLTGSWTISVCLHHIPSAGGQAYYVFGDKTASLFRCIANGTSGPNTLTLRATNIVDVVVQGATIPGEPAVTHFVYDAAAGEIRAYVNGVLKTTVAQTFNPITLTGTSTLKVGGYSSDLVDQALVGVPENGILDEFRIYNRALSQAEIESSWQFGVIPTKPDYEITTTGGQLSIVDISGNGETLTLSAPSAGQILFSVPGRRFRVDGGALRDNDSGPLNLSSITQISVSTELGHDQISIGAFTGLPSLVVSGGEGNDLVTFTGGIAFAPDASLNVDQRNGTDRCIISGQLQLSGTGAATVRTHRDIVLHADASISVEDGDLTLEAHQQAIPLSENFTALDLHGTLSSTGEGKISLLGRGAAGAVAAPGILLEDASISSSGSGTVNLTGTVHGDSGVGSTAVVLRRSTVTSAGSTTITGTGGASPAIAEGALGSAGVVLESTATLTIQGSAQLTVEGTGGQTTGRSHGVLLLGGISGAGQIVSVTGTSLNATPDSTANHGAVIQNTIHIGAGELRITGKAGFDGTDVDLGTGAALTAATQKISGTKTTVGNATLTAGILLQFTADMLSIHTAAALSGSTTEILTKSAARPIELGSADSASILGLTDAELDRITSDTLKIGDSSAGAITQLAALSRSGALELRSGGNISLQTGTITAGALLLDATSTITTKVIGTDADLTSGGPGTLSFGSGDTLHLTITSVADFDMLHVLGAVDLTGLALQLSGTHAPAEYGEHFVIIDNDGSDAITGTFSGLPEGSVMTFNGEEFKITYLGGDGNDVVLYTKPDYLVTSTSGGGPLNVNNPSGTDDALHFSQLAGGDISVTATGRTFTVDNGPVRLGGSGPVSIASGVTTVVLDAGAGDDVIVIGAATGMAPLTIHGGRGNDSVSFTGAIDFKPDADLDVDLTNDDPVPGVDRCTIGAQLTLLGTGSATFKVTRNLILTAGSGVSVVDGDLLLQAHTTGAALVDNFTAIELRGGLVSTGTGSITVHGRGAAGAAEAAGVWIYSADIDGAGDVEVKGTIAGTSAVRSLGLHMVDSGIVAAGELQVTGHSGAGTGTTPEDMASVGILMEQSSLIEGTSGKPMSVSGLSAAITGTGSSAGTVVHGSAIKNTSCHMSLEGTGGTAASGISRGLLITHSARVLCLGVTTSSLNGTAASSVLAPAGVVGSLGCFISTDSLVEGDTAGGSISVTGSSALSDISSRGLVVEGSISGNGAALSLTGTSVNSTSGSAHNDGLMITGTLEAPGQALNLTGSTHSTAGDSFGVSTDAASSITAATLSIVSDSLELGGTATCNTATLRPKTNAFAIGLGSSDTDTLLGLSSAELGRITSGTIVVGHASAGTVEQSAAISLAGDLELRSGASITTGQISTTGEVLLAPGTYVTPSPSGTTITATKVHFATGSNLRIQIASDGAYQGLYVNGEVDVSNAGLDIVGTYVPPPGYTILPVVNDGADPIIGTFISVPEDGEYPFNGEEFIITYLGGDGNDLEMFTYGDPIVTLGPLTLNQDTGLYEHVLTLTNPQPKAMRGVRVTVLNLLRTMQLRTRSHPFLPIYESDIIVPARGSATLTMVYYSGGRRPGNWVPQYLVESLNRDLGPLPGDFSGLYHGMAARTAEVNPRTGSRLIINLTRRGTYTGSLTTDGRTLRLAGVVTIDALHPLNPIIRQTLASIQRQLNVSFEPLHNRIFGELTPLPPPNAAPSTTSQAAPVAPVSGWRHLWRTTAPLNPAPGYKGRHNMALTHDDADASVPQGAAFACLNVAKDDGRFAMSGRLPDGSAITGASFIGPEGQALVFAPLYKNQGSLLGRLQVTLLRPTIPNPSIIPNPVSGTLDWKRPPALPASKDRFYRQGVTLLLQAEGGLYTSPAAGQLIAALPASASGTPNSVMEFVDGGLDIHDGFAQLLRLYNPAPTGTTNKVQLTSPTPYAVSVPVFNSNTGLFSGRFTVPGAVSTPSRRGTYSGMMVPKVGYLLGIGHFLLPQLPAPPQTTANSPILSGKVHFWDNRVPPTP